MKWSEFVYRRYSEFCWTSLERKKIMIDCGIHVTGFIIIWEYLKTERATRRKSRGWKRENGYLLRSVYVLSINSYQTLRLTKWDQPQLGLSIQFLIQTDIFIRGPIQIRDTGAKIEILIMAVLAKVRVDITYGKLLTV